jgi:hypothetical protein
MKKFIRNHPDTILIVLALAFLATIIGLYFWGVNSVVLTVNQALNYIPPEQSVGFNLSGAAKLDWRGLVAKH